MERVVTSSSSLPFEDKAAEAASLLRTLSNESRLLVLCHLAESAELAVGELVERIGLSQSALSQHLAKLREEGLVTTRKEAQSVYYRICDPRSQQILALLHDIFCPELDRGPAKAKQIGDEQ